MKKIPIPKQPGFEKSPMKVLWSLDAFEGQGEARDGVVKVLEALDERHPLDVEAAYVLGPDQLDLPIEFSRPWIREYRPAAELALKERVQRGSLRRPVRSKVIVQTNPSVARSVSAMAAHARSSGAELVVVGTHARGGLPRVFMGSFAEALLAESRVPVLTVNPDWAKKAKRSKKGALHFETILFPTDFSTKSFKAFRKLLEFAQGMGSRVIILHSIPNPVEPVFQSGVYLLGGGWVPVPNFIERLEKEQREIGQKWAEYSRKSGVEAELVIDTSGHGVVESIQTQVKRARAGMIAMSAQSGKVSAALLGSVTRKVVRSADRPVWVYKV